MEGLTATKVNEHSTRTEILHLLKAHGHLEAKAIAEFCGFTTMAVRRHLLRLCADRVIQTRTERRPKGRPTTLYSLTDLGDAQFPRDYAALATELLSSLELLDGKSKIEAVFRRRRSNLIARYGHRVRGEDLEKRVREMAAVLTDCGYMAEVEVAGSGRFLLIEHNCAIREVAECYPVACQEELCLIGELCGGSVARASHVLAGDRHCSYLVEEGGGSKRPEESPARSESPVRRR